MGRRSPLRPRAIWLAALAISLSLPPSYGQQPTVYLHPATDPSHHLTKREFLKDIGYNFLGLINKQSILPLLAGTALTSAATAPEQRLERHFAPGDIWGAWADPARYVGNSFILGGVSATLFGLSRKSDNQKFRSLSYALIHGSIMDAALTLPLKEGFHRLRPNGEDHLSFPSGHAVDSFMYATVFTEHYGWKAAIPGYAIATYVAATRMEERKHHITDVAAGAAIGFLVGHTVSRRMREENPYRFSWAVYPSRGGFTGAVRVALP